MKVVHLLLIAIFTCTLGLSTLPDNSNAATTDKKEVVSSTDTAKSAKAVKKAKKEIPHDVNINTADKDLLTQLPGIGPVTADIIIQYRKDNGNFSSIDELTKVKGIGNKTLEKLKPYLFKI